MGGFVNPRKIMTGLRFTRGEEENAERFSGLRRGLAAGNESFFPYQHPGRTETSVLLFPQSFDMCR
jgi:hypothetical protein